MSNEQPSFYAIIPANVRYDKSLKPNAKLLYGELTALANKTGYCWSGNKYFADLYGVTNSSISKWIAQLRDNGYISVKMIYKEGTKEVEQRKIYIQNKVVEENDIPIVKKDKGYSKNLHDPIGKMCSDSITSFNNTINNTSNIKDNVTSVPLPVSKEEDKYPYKEVIDYLNKSANKGFKYVASHKKHIVARFKEGFTLEEFKKVIEVKTHQWLNDPKNNIYLRPETLFGNKMDGYLQEYYKPNNGQKKYQQPTPQVTSIKQPISFTPTELDENGFNGCNFEISWIGKRNIDHNLIIHYYKEHIKNTGALLKSGGREITVQELIEEIEWDRKVKVSV